jgi:hypothetical protein
MPRPAIIYTTEVAHADALYENLREMGFERLGLMTGKSSSGTSKDEVIKDWRENRLDLVVGTSAFGLGIDNPHVRTVIHACIPETIDRFYQEVGRGGRDGCSSASIMIPAEEPSRRVRDDYNMARQLNKRRLLTVELAHKRWEAMFNSQEKQHEGGMVHQIRVDGSPGFESKYIDMVGDLNTEWNNRTLTLMANARMIELLGPSSVAEPQEPIDDEAEESNAAVGDQFRQYQRIKIIEPSHIVLSKWQEMVDPLRERMDKAYEENLQSMFRFMKGTQCSADILAPVYQLTPSSNSDDGIVYPEVAKTCGGCAHCRSHDKHRGTEPAKNVRHPWPSGVLQLPASQFVDSSNRALILYPDENEIGLRIKRRWLEALGKLASCGVRNIISISGAPLTVGDIQKEVPEIALFTTCELPPWNNLPPGPTMMFLPNGFQLTNHILQRRDASNAHFIFVHRESEDPDVKGIPLRKRFNGRQYNDLKLFNDQVNQ